MSRWVESFESHAFRAVWSDLKNQLFTVEADDQTVLTSVEEILRFKKVVEYLDGLIEGIDPELVPESIWVQFEQQAKESLVQITAFASNRNITHMEQANKHADNLLTYLRPYMVLPKNAAISIKRAATIYADGVEDYVGSFQEKAKSDLDILTSYKESALSISEHITEQKDSIDDISLSLFGQEGEIGEKDRFFQLVKETEDQGQKIFELHQKLFVSDDDDDLSIRQKIHQAKDNILESDDKVDALVLSIKDKISDLEQFHIDMLGSQQDDDEKREGGLVHALDDLKASLVDFEEAQKEKYRVLNEEIETLLPGATSAGLGAEYDTLANSFDAPITIASRVFYFSLGFLVLVSLLMFVDSIGGEKWITLTKTSEWDWDAVFKSLMYKLPLYIPILWLAHYSSKRRSEYQRLQQEYLHKKSLAASYSSYKKQIEKLDDTDNVMSKDLILKAVEAIAYNASETLDKPTHGDKSPYQEAITKLAEQVENLVKQK